MDEKYIEVKVMNEKIVFDVKGITDEECFEALCLVLRKLDRNADLEMVLRLMLQTEQSSSKQMEQLLLNFKKMMKDTSESQLYFDFNRSPLSVMVNTKIIGIFVSITYLYALLDENGDYKNKLSQMMRKQGVKGLRKILIPVKKSLKLDHQFH